MYIQLRWFLPYMCPLCVGLCVCVSRTSALSHGFVLLNRLSSDNLQEMVHPGSEYRVQGQFVLFKKHSGKIPCSVCVLL